MSRMNPFAILLLLFLMIPILEIYLLIKVGGSIGAMPTVILVVFTAVIGVWLLRIQGFSTLQKVKKIVAAGGIPAFELVEGLILLVAGALLLTPGFFTDTIGFLCLMPALRRLFLIWISGKFMPAGVVGAGSANSSFSPQDNPNQASSSPFTRPRPKGVPASRPEKNNDNKQNVVIEGEFQREDDDYRK